MDQQTSPTCHSCRQYWNNLPAHRKREILSRGEWTTFMLLINLPPTRRHGGCHHLSDNEGVNEADDANVGEDSVSDDADDANDANEEDHLYITQPPSDNDDNHDHNGDEDDNEDKENDDSYNSYTQGDIAIYDSDNHLIIDDFHPYDEVDEEDEDNKDSDIDEDDDEDSDIDEDDDNKDEDEDKYKDDDKDKD